MIFPSSNQDLRPAFQRIVHNRHHMAYLHKKQMDHLHMHNFNLKLKRPTSPYKNTLKFTEPFKLAICEKLKCQKSVLVGCLLIHEG